MCIKLLIRKSLYYDGRSEKHQNILLCISILAAAPSKGLSKELAGIAGSNPPGDMDVCLFCGRCVLLGRGLCVGLITRPKESYVWD